MLLGSLWKIEEYWLIGKVVKFAGGSFMSDMALAFSLSILNSVYLITLVNITLLTVNEESQKMALSHLEGVVALGQTVGLSR